MLVLKQKGIRGGKQKQLKNNSWGQDFFPLQTKNTDTSGIKAYIYPTNSTVSETKTATTTTAARRTEMVTINGRAHLKGKKEKVRLWYKLHRLLRMPFIWIKLVPSPHVRESKSGLPSGGSRVQTPAGERWIRVSVVVSNTDSKVYTVGV